MFALLHIPKCREIVIGAQNFNTKVDANAFMTTHELFYLAEQDKYVAYEKKALKAIKIPIEVFITNASGYHVQTCEIEIVEVK